MVTTAYYVQYQQNKGRYKLARVAVEETENLGKLPPQDKLYVMVMTPENKEFKCHTLLFMFNFRKR